MLGTSLTIFLTFKRTLQIFKIVNKLLPFLKKKRNYSPILIHCWGKRSLCGERNLRRNGSKREILIHIIRCRYNHITSIHDLVVGWKIDQNLFSSSLPSFPPNLDNLIVPSLSLDNFSHLCDIPNAIEICNIVFSLKSGKSPGPDGMSPHFFKYYGHIVGFKVTHVVQYFFLTMVICWSLFITLLLLLFLREIILVWQNTSNPSFSVKWSIKLSQKFLLIDSKPFLDRLISPFQSAFI